MFLIANTFAICFNKDYLLTYLHKCLILVASVGNYPVLFTQSNDLIFVSVCVKCLRVFVMYRRA